MNSSHIFEAIRCAISSFVLIHHKEWHSRKKKPASNRDLSEYNTCENSLERFWAEVMNTIAHLIMLREAVESKAYSQPLFVY